MNPTSYLMKTTRRFAFLAALPVTTLTTLTMLLPATQAQAQKAMVMPAKASKTGAAHTASATSTFVTLKLKGLDCEGCAMRVREDLMGVKGVESATVSFPKQTAVVEVSPKKTLKDEDLKAAVKHAGFSVVAIVKGKSAGTKTATTSTKKG